MQKNMKDEIIELRTKVNRARYNLMFMIILSIINILSVSSSGNILVPFSSAISTYATLFGITVSNEHGNLTFYVASLIIAVIILASFLICYIKSKTNAAFFVAALAAMLFDTFALLIIGFATGSISDFNVVTDVIVHFMTLVYLISGIKSQKQLGDFNDIPDDTVFETTEESIPEYDIKNETTDDMTAPIGKYEDDGTEPLLTGNFNGLNVFTVIRDGQAELVINEYVCDALEVTYLNEFELRAIVNDIDFYFQYRRDYDALTMFLYANNKLLDSFNKE